MLACDALIVGGGPAGSTCARTLTRAGWTVVVLDAARFPRHKVCAGWVTPSVLDLLELAPERYRAAGLVLQDITAFRTGIVGGRMAETRYTGVVSYAVRRCEFDDYLLRRAGASIRDGTRVTSIARRGDRWIVNGSFTAPVLVGAGGHFCPVARYAAAGTPHPIAIVAQAAEFLAPRAGDTAAHSAPELFFCRDLDGYGWCVRKGGYLNVGIGRRHSAGFTNHRDALVAFLERTGRLPAAVQVAWAGHAYLAAGAGTRPLVEDRLLLVGDSAGLAYPESGEGIRPAVESGLAAARILIAAAGDYSAERLRPYADAMRQLHPPARLPRRPSLVNAAVGRALVGFGPFARRVLLDRWFLRRHDRPVAAYQPM